MVVTKDGYQPVDRDDHPRSFTHQLVTCTTSWGCRCIWTRWFMTAVTPWLPSGKLRLQWKTAMFHRKPWKTSYEWRIPHCHGHVSLPEGNHYQIVKQKPSMIDSRLPNHLIMLLEIGKSMNGNHEPWPNLSDNFLDINQYFPVSTVGTSVAAQLLQPTQRSCPGTVKSRKQWLTMAKN